MNHYKAYRFFLTFIAAISFSCGIAQRLITEKEIIDLAIKNSGALQASDLQVAQNKYLQKTGFNIPNPEVIAESPTGEFYAVGVLQSMEFPSVYVKQNQLRKQMTRLSEKQKNLTRQEVSSLIQSLYLNLQFAEALQEQLKVQDSLYSQIARSAERQFDAGTIDHLAKTFAQTQAGEIHNQFVQSRLEYEAIRNQLKMYTGIDDDFTTTELVRSSLDEDVRMDSGAVSSNPSIQYYQQLTNVNKQSLSVERNKALPGLVFGYLNQGSKETDTYYRFRVGFTVPLWFWQYSGNIKAAKAGVQLAEQNEKAQRQALASDMYQAWGDTQKYGESLNYYENTGLKQADDIINTARRFFESGQIDYVGYLRNINEAYLLKARYLETLRNYNQSIITINYLTGKL
jgi:outer membrane protein, heavy metal efflux system